MCGRYFFDGDTWKDVMRLTGEADGDVYAESGGNSSPAYFLPDCATLQAEKDLCGDVYPSTEGIVLTGNQLSPEAKASMQDKRTLHAAKMCWGFPGFRDGQLLINARSETVLEKKSFSDSVLHRRCIIPAKWFYEWDRDKNKVTFEWPKSPSVYMAGFYDFRQMKNRYVILTTQANDSMKKVHDRMPLIFPEELIFDWIYDDAKALELLKHSSPELTSRQDYEQMSLF